VDGIDFGSIPVVGFVISGVEISEYITIESVSQSVSQS
jgi:hypothetical protein